MYFNAWLATLHMWSLNKLQQQRTGTLTRCLNYDVLRKIKFRDLIMLWIKIVI